jgi:hypothetical protein
MKHPKDLWWAGPPPQEEGEIDAQRWDTYGNENNIGDGTLRLRNPLIYDFENRKNSNHFEDPVFQSNWDAHGDPDRESIPITDAKAFGTLPAGSMVGGTDGADWPNFNNQQAILIKDTESDRRTDSCWAMTHGGVDNPIPVLEPYDCGDKRYGICMVMPVPRKKEGCAETSVRRMLAAMGGTRENLNPEWARQLSEFEQNETRRVEAKYQQEVKTFKRVEAMSDLVGAYVEWRQDPKNAELVKEEEFQRQRLRAHLETMSKDDLKRTSTSVNIKDILDTRLAQETPTTGEQVERHSRRLQKLKIQRNQTVRHRNEVERAIQMAHEARQRRIASDPEFFTRTPTLQCKNKRRVAETNNVQSSPTPSDTPPSTPSPVDATLQNPTHSSRTAQLEVGHPFPDVHERLRRRELLTKAPGDATGKDHMPSHQQLIVADLDGNGFDDILTHSPGRSAGDCAMRCREYCNTQTNWKVEERS